MNLKQLLLPIGLIAIIGLCLFVIAGGLKVIHAEVAIEPRSLRVGTLATTPTSSPIDGTRYGFGRLVTEDEIAALDIDVRSDGTGLPLGSGTVEAGAVIYAEQCASCHGETGTEGPYNVLVGPYDGEAEWPQTPLTIGNYWPYASTVYDYINRAMPHQAAGSLTSDEVYALVALLLYQNEIVPADTVLDAETLPTIEMPAHKHWLPRDLRESYPFR